MFRSMLHAIARGIRWLLFSITVLLLVEELVRVPIRVLRTWGLPHALVDGAVGYQLGQAAILLPFLFFVHFRGAWGPRRSAVFARRARWAMWAGGLLCLVSWFDLTGRVPWAWWCLSLAVFAALLPWFMNRTADGRARFAGYALVTILVGQLLVVYLLSIILIGSFIAPLPTSHPKPAATVAGRWQQDLDYLVSNLELLHANPYHSIPRERFAEEVARFRAAIPQLSEAEIRVGLTRIVALVGDGHTDVGGWNSPRAARYPVRFYSLSDGLFVTAVARADSAILGGRVLRLCDTGVDEAFAAAREMVPAETESHVLHMAARYLSNAVVLEALGIVEPGGRLGVEVATAAGDTITARFGTSHVELVHAPDPPPAFRQDGGKQYWSRFQDEDRTAYLKYNLFVDPVGFGPFSAGFWKEVEKRDLGYVIVDFRENGGGMSAAFDPFFDRILAHDAINRRDHLYVLVNRRTFSSAGMYTGILRRETQALVAGEEMGSAVNAYGDIRHFRLPNSGQDISFSLRYFHDWPDSLPPWRIDIPVPISSGQYFAGEDPVLDEVMRRIREDRARPQPPAGKTD